MEILSNGVLEELLSYRDTVLNVAEKANLNSNDVMNVMDDRTFIGFLDALNYTGFVESFDYLSWAQERNAHTASIKDVAAEVKNADLEELRKLMTMHIRIERFSEGHIQKLYEEGFFHRFFEKLNELMQ